MKTAITAIALGWILLQAGTSRAQVVLRQPTALPAIVLEDQFEGRQQLSDGLGRVVVLIYGDRQSADANKRLGEQLHVYFHPSARGQPPEKAHLAPVRPLENGPSGVTGPDVTTVPVACIGKVPLLVRSLIRGQIRKGSPGVPVWLDFQDQMKQLFGLAPGVPNVVVVDVQGRLRCTATGMLSSEQLTQLTAVLEGLRREAVASPASPSGGARP